MGNDQSRSNSAAKNLQNRHCGEKLKNPEIIAAFNELNNDSKNSVNFLGFEVNFYLYFFNQNDRERQTKNSANPSGCGWWKNTIVK